MAVIYLRSADGSDASDGLTWANAKATLAAALTAAGAGGTVYVADGHAESQASAMTLASPGTAGSPVRVICVVDTGDPEPPTAVATTGAVTVTGGNGIGFSGFAYCYGVIFSAGSGGAGFTNRFTWISNNAWWWRYDACKLTIGGSAADQSLVVGCAGGVNSNDQLLELINTPITFGHASNEIFVECPVVWRDTPSAVQGTAPDVLFVPQTAENNVFHRIECRGVDLSALGSGKTLIDAAGIYGDAIFENCKLGASVAITTGNVLGQGGATVRLVNCDSADTNYRYFRKLYQGEIFHEATIVRTDGASDGTTPISRKMVTSANSKFESPLVSDPLVVWNETTGSSVTATVEVVTDNVTLTDAEAWIEVEYLGTSGFPISSTASDRATNILTTPANQTTSSVSWTTTGLTTPVKQKLAVSFTPQEKGPIQVRVHLAKASTTMYFDPEVNLT